MLDRRDRRSTLGRTVLTTEARYDPVAKSLHWLIVVLIGAQFFTALASADSFAAVSKQGLIRWHLAVGPAILLVMVVRLAWRVAHRTPAPPAELPTLLRGIAIAAHWAFYALLIVIPILGWIATSERGEPPSLFFMTKLPVVAAPDVHAAEWWGAIHGWLAFLLLALVAMHIAAACWHGLARDDGVFARMMPGRDAPRRSL